MLLTWALLRLARVIGRVEDLSLARLSSNDSVLAEKRAMVPQKEEGCFTELKSGIYRPPHWRIREGGRTGPSQEHFAAL
jgi:hypothetical protein